MPISTKGYQPYEHSSTVNSPARETTQETINRINSQAVASSTEKVPCVIVQEVLRASNTAIVSLWHAAWNKGTHMQVYHAKKGFQHMTYKQYSAWMGEIETSNQEKLS